MPQAVIFDIDGVLVDSYQAHFQSWRQLLAGLDVEFSEAEFRATFGHTSRDIIAQLYAGKLSDEKICALDNRKEALFRDILRETLVVIPGALELVDALAEAGFLLAVGSSAPPENVSLTLELLNLTERFQARVTGGDVARGKPDPQVFQLAAERLGVAPQHCAVIEDAVAGVEAANRAGMASIGLTGTATRDQLSHAALVVDRLSELTPAGIARLLAKHGGE